MHVEGIERRFIPIEAAVTAQDPAAFGLLDDVLAEFNHSLREATDIGRDDPLAEVRKRLGID